MQDDCYQHVYSMLKGEAKKGERREVLFCFLPAGEGAEPAYMRYAFYLQQGKIAGQQREAGKRPAEVTGLLAIKRLDEREYSRMVAMSNDCTLAMELLQDEIQVFNENKLGMRLTAPDLRSLAKRVAGRDTQREAELYVNIMCGSGLIQEINKSL